MAAPGEHQHQSGGEGHDSSFHGGTVRLRVTRTDSDTDRHPGDATPMTAPTSPTPGPKAADAARIAQGYAFTGAALELGSVVLDNVAYPEAQIRVPLAMLNRHGLIAGATGTGKTKTLQVLTEQLSRGRRPGRRRRHQGRPVRAGPARHAQRQDHPAGQGHRRRLGGRPRSRSSSSPWAASAPASRCARR